MGIIRNFINIEGITHEEELLKNQNGHTIVYSDTETIFFPENKPEIKSIYEVMLNIDITSHRSINTPIGKIIVLDGVKKYKIIYTENNDLERMSILNHELPFNSFTESPVDFDDIWNIDIHIIDAYFSLLDKRKIYGHYLYLLDINYEKEKNNSLSKKFDVNASDNVYIKGEPLKDMLKELSISENYVKDHKIDPLLDPDEEIL